MQRRDGRVDAVEPQRDNLMPLSFHNREVVMGETDIAGTLHKDSLHGDHIVMCSVAEMQSNAEATEDLIDVAGSLSLWQQFRSQLHHSTSAFSL